MDIALCQYDVIDMINDLTDNLPFIVYYLDEDNKDAMYRMIRKKSKMEPPPNTKDYYLIFYNIGEVIGHWCAMIIDYETQEASFFCSFGLFIDGQFQYGAEYQKDDDLVKDILKYLYEKDFIVYYNDEQLQNIKSNCCGRYVATYIAAVAAMKNDNDSIDPRVFTDYIMDECEDRDMTPDEVIVEITTK